LESLKSNFIQLADICNFYINRYHSMKLGVVPVELKKRHIESMYEKIEPFIIKPISNPEELKEMLAFFVDNAELLGKK
jgi:non-ribosomal peptide synthetase component E (peptide arylation enzyme)